jgi:hypothetical protein
MPDQTTGCIPSSSTRRFSAPHLRLAGKHLGIAQDLPLCLIVAKQWNAKLTSQMR